MKVVVEKRMSVTVEIFPNDDSDSGEIIGLAETAAGEYSSGAWRRSTEELQFFDEDGEELT